MLQYYENLLVPGREESYKGALIILGEDVNKTHEENLCFT